MKYKLFISKFRLSSHCLAIETGRHKKVPRDQRFCKICNSGDIEDEYHFIFKCQLYQNEREKLFKPYYWRRPSMYKLINLLSTSNVKELCNLGKFIEKASNLRSKALVEPE